MKSKKNLVLVGMMGSGKSTIGSLIAKKLNKKFIDIDKIIEKETKMTIAQIFEKKGEIFFRKLEEKITLVSLDGLNNIISLGGGGFINEKIRKEVLTNHTSFWLNLETSALLSRVRKNKKRPILSKLSDKEFLDLIISRTKIYSKAQFKINCNKITKTEIVKEIIKFYEKN